MKIDAMVIVSDKAILSDRGHASFKKTVDVLTTNAIKVWAIIDHNQKRSTDIAASLGCAVIRVRNSTEDATWPYASNLCQVAAWEVCKDKTVDKRPAAFLWHTLTEHDLWNDYIAPSISKMQEFNVGEVFTVDQNMVEVPVFRLVRTAYALWNGVGNGDRAVTICDKRICEVVPQCQ